MGISKIFKIFTSRNSPLPTTHDSLVVQSFTTTAPRDGLRNKYRRLLRKLLSGKKIDWRSKTEEEEKVYRWIYALARSQKDLVFEYVRSTERGLSFSEAERRLKESGPNIPFQYSFPNWWHLLWNALFHSFNIILIVLSAISYITRDDANGSIMLALVFISVSLRFYKEYNSSNAAMKLSEFVNCPVKVQRCAGRTVQSELIVQVDQRDVVPGDIIIFEPGDLFPGDVRLLAAKNLVVCQSSLTGESGSTEKTADIRESSSTPLLELKNICFMGTSVVSGVGTGLVVSTGSKTYMSTMFSTIQKQKQPDDFERGIRHISYLLVATMLIAVTIVVVICYYQSHDLSDSLLFGISVASALTPQMLPLIINTGLAKGALAMAKDRCVVKSLTAIQDMGSMHLSTFIFRYIHFMPDHCSLFKTWDIICIDKTGTLTMNSAMLMNYLDSWGSPKEKVLCFAFLNAYFKTQQRYPLDDAIMAYAYTNSFRFQPSKWSKLDEIPFDFTRRCVSVILERQVNEKDKSNYFSERVVITKGALEEVIKVCSFVEHVGQSYIRRISAEDHYSVLNLAEELSNNGLRLLGVAYRFLETEPIQGKKVYDERVESDMVFLGLLSFIDPPKDSAKQALLQLDDKGVKAKVLTGDTPSLAIRICKEVGISTAHVITGPDLDLLDNDSFHEIVKRTTVLARLTPSQKLRVVEALQTEHIVGFLGDGVNDSLALEAANVGISVDSGASIAKDASDIILLEKDLNVLAGGVELGRITFGNTMKYIKMSVIANLGSILGILLATCFLQYEPLTPRQLLIQNFLYNLGQIAIPWDKMEDKYVKIPQRWSLRGLAMFTMWNAPVITLCDFITLLFLSYYYKARPKSDMSFIHSAWFIEGLLMQTLIIHLIRTEKIPFIQEAASWPVICSTVLISSVGITIVLAPVGQVLGFVPLPLSYFGFLIVLFLGYFTVGQIVKQAYIYTYKKWL